MHRTPSKIILQRAAVALVASAWTATSVHAAPVTKSIQVSRIASDSTNRVGGSGGSPYNLSCSEGQVLIGIQAREGLYVDGVTGICRGVTTSGSWTSTQSLTGSAGGSGGSPSRVSVRPASR
jgi:hypothetical protein